MSTVDIFYSIRPKRGKYISQGKYGFGIVDGAPSFSLSNPNGGISVLGYEVDRGNGKMGQKGSTGVSRQLGRVAIRGNYGRSHGLASRNDKDHRYASVCSLLPKPSGTFRFVSRFSADRLC